MPPYFDKGLLLFLLLRLSGLCRLLKICRCFLYLAGTPESDYVTLREEYGLWRLEILPEYSTGKGFYQWNDQLENFSPDFFDIIKVYIKIHLFNDRKVPAVNV